MDNRRLMIAMLIAMPLMFFWITVGYPWLGKRLGYDMARRPATQPVAQNNGVQPTQPTTGPAAAPATGVAEGALHAVASGPSTPIVIGSEAEKDPAFRMGITLRALGAGVDRVVLNEFKRTARGKEPYAF